MKIPTLRHRLLSRFHYNLRVKMLLIPYLLGILLLVFIPAALSFTIAFFKYDALSPPVWAGELNFILTYTDELFNLSMQNSLSLVILPVPLRVLGAFLLARLMQRKGRLISWLRASIYIPSIIPSVAYALAWLWILNPLFGPLNLILRAIGLAAPNWFSDPLSAKLALILMSLWQIGEGFLVSLTALQDTPPELEDAARIDGAASWHIFWRITLPLLAPILLLLSFRDAILALQESFTAILLTTNGGPYYATFTLPLFVYEQSFDLLSFGTASAALWAIYALTGLIILVLYVIATQWNIGTTDDTFII